MERQLSPCALLAGGLYGQRACNTTVNQRTMELIRALSDFELLRVINGKFSKFSITCVLPARSFVLVLDERESVTYGGDFSADVVYRNVSIVLTENGLGFVLTNRLSYYSLP